MKIWCELVCDNCNTVGYGRFYQKGDHTMERIRVWAKWHGWKEFDGMTLCPECVKKIESGGKA